MGDDPEVVVANRAHIGEAQFMNQVHGDEIMIVDSVTPEVPTCDGLITTKPAISLAVMVADCIPLLLKSKESVAAVHVGRRGLVNEITRKTISLMREMGSTQITAIIGPAICGSCYEVSEDVFQEVISVHPFAETRTPLGTFALDLPAALRSVLSDEGVAILNKFDCTVENSDLFSYRRDGITGRQAGLISI